MALKIRSGDRVSDVILWVTGTLVSYVEQCLVPKETIKLELSGMARKDFKNLIRSGFEPEWSEILICLETLEDEGLIDKSVYKNVINGLPEQYGIA